ncbi:lasso peptide biosynthesis B2 protein [Sphingopyxis witflariensis]|uniref:Microcin J25-processing protein McjB C-terminal domain-containing protein n=1 Tax=Sphingopyxis witflariensis TaxID=173675 RepID=A0A2D0AMD6_9SPHN|nr:lasso peptide biosynthesis B2 protein [Sphingopyxis witflariensis]OWQ94309.1 hypothetical protein CDQ91_15060 [Sphingopyxis witflariensis]
MAWTLAPGVGFCIAGEELIFLDLRADRYLALRGDQRAAFERLRARAPNDSDAMTGLVATGLFVRSDEENQLNPVDIAVPTADLGKRRRGSPPMRMAASAARYLYWARRAQAPDRLAATVANLSRQKRAEAGRADADAIAEMAADYALARTLIPIAPRCLIDSLALFRLLLRRNLAPTMVFGVRPAPFAAHCWLQSSERVLTGSVDDAHNFTPIFML